MEQTTIPGADLETGEKKRVSTKLDIEMALVKRIIQSIQKQDQPARRRIMAYVAAYVDSQEETASTPVEF